MVKILKGKCFNIDSGISHVFPKKILFDGHRADKFCEVLLIASLAKKILLL